MLPRGSSLVRIAGGPGSDRARPVLRQPSVDRPRNSRLLLRDPDASLCQSLLRHRGQRHVRAVGRVSRNLRVCSDDRCLSDLPWRRGGGTPTDTGNDRPGRGNDTFPPGQRHVGRGQRHPGLGVPARSRFVIAMRSSHCGRAAGAAVHANRSQIETCADDARSRYARAGRSLRPSSSAGSRENRPAPSARRTPSAIASR
jgi:hypothetical protein